MEQYTNIPATRPRPHSAHPASGDVATGSTTSLVGFGPLTRFETDFGQVPAQALRVRDRLRLHGGRYCPIRRIEKVFFDEAFLDRNPDAQPVLIEPGSLGLGLPSEPILLAPGQKLSGRQGLPVSYERARDLLGTGKAHRRTEQLVTYVVISFGEPVDICSGGLWLRAERLPVQPADED
jgi:hypothetical protein